MEMFLDLAETPDPCARRLGRGLPLAWRYDIATGREEKIEHFSNRFTLRRALTTNIC